jgi:hypothetical protein
LEPWTPGLFLHLDREREPEAWWALKRALAGGSRYAEGLLREVDVERKAPFEFPPFLRKKKAR